MKLNKQDIARTICCPNGCARPEDCYSSKERFVKSAAVNALEKLIIAEYEQIKTSIEPLLRRAEQQSDSLRHQSVSHLGVDQHLSKEAFRWEQIIEEAKKAFI